MMKKEKIETTEVDATLEALASLSFLDDDQSEDASDEICLDDLEDAVTAATKDDAKAEVYKEQDDGLVEVLASDAPSSETLDKKSKTARAKAFKSTMTSSKKSEVLKEKLGEKLSETLILEVADAELDADTLKKQQDAMLEAIDNLAVKVGEKAVNLISAVNGSSKLSIYTELAIKYAVANPKGFTITELAEHYQDQKANGVKGYSVGTARSQSNQMSQLFSATKVAKLEGKLMVLNEDSLIVAAITAITK